jgi:hypothetical protein
LSLGLAGTGALSTWAALLMAGARAQSAMRANMFV